MSNLKIDAAPGEVWICGLHDYERYIYDDIQAENWSSIKPYSVPQQARWREKNPLDSDTDALRFGRMAHELILTPKIFAGKYCESKKPPHGGGALRDTTKTNKSNPTDYDQAKGNREWKKSWESKYKGYQWIEADTWKQLHDMQAALKEDPITNSILSYPGSMREVTCLSVLPDGTRTKSMFDIVLELDDVEARAMFNHRYVSGGVWIGDYKTARSAKPSKFKWAVDDYGYKGQAAFYFDNYARATGVEPAGFFFFAQEKSNGCTPCVFLVTPNDVRAYRRDYEHLMKVKANCKKTNAYPGYATSALFLGDL